MGRRAAGSILTTAGDEGNESVVRIDGSLAADAGDDDHYCQPSCAQDDARADDDNYFRSEDDAYGDADETFGSHADGEVVGGAYRDIGSSTEEEGGEGWNSDDAGEYDEASTPTQADEAEGDSLTNFDETYYETTDDELTDGESDITFVLLRDGCFVDRCLERRLGPGTG